MCLQYEDMVSDTASQHILQRTHVSGTIRGVITTPDAGARTGRFKELQTTWLVMYRCEQETADLDVVVISNAGTSLWITIAPGTATRIVLTTGVPRIQTIQTPCINATSNWKIIQFSIALYDQVKVILTLGIPTTVLSLPTAKRNIPPEVRG